MSAAKHTPGPWTAPGGIYVFTEDGETRYIAHTLSGIPAVAIQAIDDQERAANARLIAAAPDMLQLLLEVQDGVYDADPVAHMNWLARVDAAILKATGFAS